MAEKYNVENSVKGIKNVNNKLVGKISEILASDMDSVDMKDIQPAEKNAKLPTEVTMQTKGLVNALRNAEIKKAISAVKEKELNDVAKQKQASAVKQAAPSASNQGPKIG